MMGMRANKSDIAKLVAAGAVVGPSVRLPSEEPARSVDKWTKPGAVHCLTISNWKPSTLNQLMRGKIKDRIALGKAERAIIAFSAIEQNIPNATGRRRVSLEITLEGRQKEGDADCYFKGLLDALVSCGLLLGDKSSQVQLGDVVHKRGKSQTVITLEDV